MLFIAKDELENYCQYNGLLHGGGFYLLSIQLLMALSLTVWAMVVTYILLWVSFLYNKRLRINLGKKKFRIPPGD